VATIYLDLNIAHYFVRGFPQSDGDPALAENSALSTALAQHPGLRFVVSPWNLIEAAQEREADNSPLVLPKRYALALTERYAEFYERLMPLHNPAPDVVQREEMKVSTYVALELVKTKPEIPVFWEHLSQVLSLSGIETLVGYDLRTELRYLAKSPEGRRVLEGAKQTSLWALKEAIKAREQGHSKDLEVQRNILRAWFGCLMPLRGRTVACLPWKIESEFLICSPTHPCGCSRTRRQFGRNTRWPVFAQIWVGVGRGFKMRST
jgi:hypothetical protein